MTSETLFERPKQRTFLDDLPWSEFIDPLHGWVRSGRRPVVRRTTDVDYPGAHMRVRRLRGPASEYECQDRGLPATEWSYNHNDPNEWQGWHPTKCVWLPCGQPEFYSPRCKKCHARFDGPPPRERFHAPRWVQVPLWRGDLPGD